MKKNKLILIGGGGHCKSCIDVIEQQGVYDIEGVLDQPRLIGEKVLTYDIIGSDDSIKYYSDKGFFFLITIGQIKSAKLRIKLFQQLQEYNANIASIISPLAYISKYSSIKRGTIVMHGAKINAGVTIGENNILNTGSTIEHDVKIGNHCHISTNVVINGDCKLEDEIFVGSNATIINQIDIKSKIIIGAGALVNKNIFEQGVYAGNPIIKL